MQTPAPPGADAASIWVATAFWKRTRRCSTPPVGDPKGLRHITEEFALTEHDISTRLDYSGKLSTDFGTAGGWWADRVAAAWEAAVRSSFTSIRTEAERRARPGTANF
jgi:hypothetical protein